MKIEIKNRATIENTIFDKNTALISITDYDYDFAKLKNQPNYLLQLAFDDIDADIFADELGRAPTETERRQIENEYHMLSDEQAKEVVNFYNKVCDKVDVIICQCEHGQSRSAAIAAAILEYKSRKGIDIFADDNYYPNKTVFKKILKYLQTTE